MIEYFPFRSLIRKTSSFLWIQSVVTLRLRLQHLAYFRILFRCSMLLKDKPLQPPSPTKHTHTHTHTYIARYNVFTYLQPRIEEDTELIEDQEDVHAVAAYYAGTYVTCKQFNFIVPFSLLSSLLSFLSLVFFVRRSDIGQFVFIFYPFLTRSSSQYYLLHSNYLHISIVSTTFLLYRILFYCVLLCSWRHWGRWYG